MNQDIERWTRELLAAGWKPHRNNTLWEAPNGQLFIGPYGAWKTMTATVTWRSGDQAITRNDHERRTPEERLADFVDTLARGGSLVVHPDTWAEWKANVAKLPPELATLTIFNRINVITSEIPNPGEMIAAELVTFDTSPQWSPVAAEPSFHGHYVRPKFAPYLWMGGE